MSIAVLDSSAVLAVLQQESGREQVITVLDHAVLCAVNSAEIQSKLIRDGMSAHEARIALDGCVQNVLPFDARHADIAASLITQTRPYGLSVGDRACLALAMALNAPVYTTDRAWAQLQVGVEIRLIR